MKKTLITLLALSSLPMAAIEMGTEFTLDSHVGTTSVFEAMVDSTADAAATATGLQINRLGYPNCTADIHVNQLLSSINLSELAPDQFLLVDQVQFVFRDLQQTTYLPTTSSLTTTVGGETYTAGNAAIDYVTGSYGTLTFTMDTPIKLTGLEANVQFALSATGAQLGFGVAKNNGAATILGANDFGSGWCPVVRLSGTVAPEPATATLSLLALAGLAARRKRH